MNVLVADDHYANQLLTEKILTRHGYHVTLADHGQQAVTFCTIQSFDLILLDIQMPVLDGIEALRKIRASSTSNCDQPIFALTAHMGHVERAALLGVGFDAVLLKPFRIETMERHLNHLPLEKNHPILENSFNLALIDTYSEILSFPLIDLMTLDTLYSTVGITNLHKIFDAYWADIDKILKALLSIDLISTVTSKITLMELRRNAHSIKGASANVGLQRASSIASQLQNAPIEDIPFLIEYLQLCIKESRTNVSEYIDAIETSGELHDIRDYMAS